MTVVGVYDLSVVKALYWLWTFNMGSTNSSSETEKRENTTFHVSSERWWWLGVNACVDLIMMAL